MSPSAPTIHASACVIERYGVMVIGDSGSGKTTLCDALVRSVELVDSPPRLPDSMTWNDSSLPFIFAPSCCVDISVPLVLSFLGQHLKTDLSV